VRQKPSRGGVKKRSYFLVSETPSRVRQKEKVFTQDDTRRYADGLYRQTPCRNM
jgi:hypothetical protein